MVEEEIFHTITSDSSSTHRPIKYFKEKLDSKRLHFEFEFQPLWGNIRINLGLKMQKEKKRNPYFNLEEVAGKREGGDGVVEKTSRAPSHMIRLESPRILDL